MRVGSSCLSTGGTVYTVTKKWIHPEYTTNLRNDVGLLKIAPSCFCSPPSVTLNRDRSFPSTTGHPLTVIGFGRTAEGGGPSEILQKLGVGFVNDDECATKYGSFDQNIKMCADKDGGGTCQGDSGSPLLNVDSVTGAISQVGIVSYGIDSCASNYPDYYARVSSFVDWVEATMSTEMSTFGPDREPVLSFLRTNSMQWIESMSSYLFAGY